MSSIVAGFGRAAAVASLVAAAALGTAGSAEAAYTDCPSNRFCIWDNANATGLWANFSSGTSDLGSSEVFGGRLNDKTSYVYNRRSDPWCVYQHKNRGGKQLIVYPGQRFALTFRDSTGFYWNDVVSSVRPAIYVAPPLSNLRYWDC